MTTADYAITRKHLRAQMKSMPDGPEKKRTKHIDKNLMFLVKNPNDAAALKALKDNMAELDKMKTAQPSEE